MEKKINLHLFYMGVVTAIIGILITTVSYYHFFRKEIKENLVHECHLVAQCYDSADLVDRCQQERKARYRGAYVIQYHRYDHLPYRILRTGCVHSFQLCG